MDRGSLHPKKFVDRFRRLGVRPVDFVRLAEAECQGVARAASARPRRSMSGSGRGMSSTR
jgi:hypothetical protein